MRFETFRGIFVSVGHLILKKLISLTQISLSQRDPLNLIKDKVLNSFTKGFSTISTKITHTPQQPTAKYSTSIPNSLYHNKKLKSSRSLALSLTWYLINFPYYKVKKCQLILYNTEY